MFFIKITVFTPTYNRAYILGQLYHSLQQQRFQDFEWLIVDDGSSDNTALLVEQWAKEPNYFPIHYHFKQNGGKCSAINDALDFAAGELFVTVDSDDYLAPDALEKIAQWEAALPKGQKYCGVSGNLGTTPFETPNALFPHGFFDGTLLDRYGCVTGERTLAFYTDIHRKYRYPIFGSERFMTEAVVWNRMAHDGYQMRFHNDILVIYEYKDDGLTNAGSKLFLDNPQGYGLWLREKAQFEHASPAHWLRLYYTFTCDLSSRRTSQEIAGYISAPYLLIAAINSLHKLIHLIRK